MTGWQRLWRPATPRFLLVVLGARCIEGWCEPGRGEVMGAGRDMWRGGGISIESSG